MSTAGIGSLNSFIGRGLFSSPVSPFGDFQPYSLGGEGPSNRIFGGETEAVKINLSFSDQQQSLLRNPTYNRASRFNELPLEDTVRTKTEDFAAPKKGEEPPTEIVDGVRTKTTDFIVPQDAETPSTTIEGGVQTKTTDFIVDGPGSGEEAVQVELDGSTIITKYEDFIAPSLTPSTAESIVAEAPAILPSTSPVSIESIYAEAPAIDSGRVLAVA